MVSNSTYFRCSWKALIVVLLGEMAYILNLSQNEPLTKIHTNGRFPAR